MFTVKNTLFGATVSALFVLGLTFWQLPGESDPALGSVAAWGAIVHVWFLLGHLHLKRLAREGKPAVRPRPTI